MGTVTTLMEVIRALDSLDTECTVYAAEPWTQVSAAVVAREPESGGLPEEVKRRGLRYFLEISIARDLLEDWSAHSGVKPTLQQKVERLIEYAISDA